MSESLYDVKSIDRIGETLLDEDLSSDQRGDNRYFHSTPVVHRETWNFYSASQGRSLARVAVYNGVDARQTLRFAVCPNCTVSSSPATNGASSNRSAFSQPEEQCSVVPKLCLLLPDRLRSDSYRASSPRNSHHRNLRDERSHAQRQSGRQDVDDFPGHLLPSLCAVPASQ
jgi:hypothetical protein